MKKAERAYASLRERVRVEWILYLLAFVFILIADSIGQIKIPVWKGAFIIFPIFYALFLGILTGPNVLKILDDKKVKAASGLVGVAILPFVAKLGINAGANIAIVISAGPALLLQEFGNLCTIFLAMPIALMLGLKREAIGATHSINRETNLALMQDMFGADSPEAQGSLSVYIVGGMVGTIYFGFMASMAAATGLFHPYALGMASGVGAGILMSSAVAALSEVMPAWADQIAAMASASETISGIDGIYMAIFIGFDVAFTESLPGVLVLLLIALCAAGLSHVIPLKLPTVAYCSILGLLCACPLSPVSQFVIESAGKINFTAPLTMVGAFAGMSISNQLKMFFKQGWKLIIITILVMTGTFFGSLVVAQVVLGLTHAI